MSASSRWHVVKLGGSLVDLADLRDRFRAWLFGQPAAGRLLVVGGGALADVVRAFDRTHGLSDVDAHWLAVRTMGLNARLLHALLPEVPLVERLEELPLVPSPGTIWLVDPWHFLRHADVRRPDPLPVGWQVTGDSIAARLAEHLGAPELTLLKSTLPTADHRSRTTAAAAGYVDKFFPIASANVPRVQCVDLRADGFPRCEIG